MSVHNPLLEQMVRDTVHVASEIEPVFADRGEAGQGLADELSRMNYPNPAVITIPTGGIPIALPVCHRLSVPIRLAFAKKVPFSSDCRFGMGAVSGLGNIILNTELIESLSLQEEYVRGRIENARSIVRYNMEKLMNLAVSLPDLSGRTAILVDDGIATGFTILSAAKDVETCNPTSIIIASPVISASAHQRVRDLGYEQVALLRSDARAFLVDNFYHSFQQLSIDDVRSMLPKEHINESRYQYDEASECR